MEGSYDYKKFAIVYVDDEELSLRSFRRAFGNTFQIFTAASAQEGMSILEAHSKEIGLLMTDQRMPGEKGVWLLERARQLCPQVVRILVTAYTDADAAIAAVNNGAIHNYIQKPWDVRELEKTLKRGLEFFMVERERDELLRTNNTLLQEILMGERAASLGFLAAGMSHHIRNWLVAAKTFVEDAPEQLRREGLDAEQLRNREFWVDLRGVAQAQIEKIEHLLRELWSASKSGELLETEQVNLREIIDAAVQTAAPDLARAGVEVENRVSASLPNVLGPRHSVQELFVLLLLDESASLPQGSRITCFGESRAVPDAAQTEVHIRLQDTGPCLPNETLRRLFNFFAPRSDSPAESGIRLMICYFLVLRLRARIWVTSEPGQGTTFHLSFYVTPPSASPA